MTDDDTDLSRGRTGLMAIAIAGAFMAVMIGIGLLLLADWGKPRPLEVLPSQPVKMRDVPVVAKAALAVAKPDAAATKAVGITPDQLVQDYEKHKGQTVRVTGKFSNLVI